MMGWILTFVTAAIVYMVGVQFGKIKKIFPQGREDSPLTWEWLANEGREGFFEDEREDAIYAVPTPPSMEAEEVDIGEKGPTLS